MWISKFPTKMGKYRILSEEQLKRLSEHRYSARGTSLLDPCMQPFWCWLVKQIPLNWAPNALTLAGLLFNGVSTLILLAYCSDAVSEAPRWCYFLCGFGLFAYQSLDAIDGKQARRTNSSSPLGELFDHGCDALSIVFVVVGTCTAGRLGSMPRVFFMECFATMIVYYSAQWQAYCSGTLNFGFIDVTEAQIGVTFMYILTGIFGASIWDVEIFSTGLPTKLIPVAISLIVGFFAYRNFFSIILRGKVDRDGSMVTGTSALAPVVPIGLLLFTGLYCWINSASGVFELHPVLYSMTFGLVATKLSCKILTLHMASSDMGLVDPIFVGPLALLLIQHFQLANEYMTLWMCCIYCSADLCRYFIGICSDICDFLDIRCFHVTHMKDVAAR